MKIRQEAFNFLCFCCLYSNIAFSLSLSILLCCAIDICLRLTDCPISRFDEDPTLAGVMEALSAIISFRSRDFLPGCNRKIQLGIQQTL